MVLDLCLFGGSVYEGSFDPRVRLGTLVDGCSRGLCLGALAEGVVSVVDVTGVVGWLSLANEFPSRSMWRFGDEGRGLKGEVRWAAALRRRAGGNITVRFWVYHSLV